MGSVIPSRSLGDSLSAPGEALAGPPGAPDAPPGDPPRDRRAARAFHACSLALAWCCLAHAPASPAALTAEEIQGLLRAGHFAEAESTARSLLADVERLHGPNSLEAAETLDLLGDAMRQGGKAGDPRTREAYERSIRVKEAVLGRSDPRTARSLASLGLLLYERNQDSEAGPIFRRALEIRERALGPNHPDVARSLQYLAALEARNGRDSSAVALIERAIRIQRAVLPSGDPALGQSLNVLASMKYNGGDFAGAGPLYEQVLGIYLTAFGPRHPRVADCYHNLGAVYTELGEPERGREYLEEALAIRRGALGKDHPLVASTLVSLASTLEDLNDAQGARTRYREALKIQERAYGMEHQDVAWTLTRLGRIESRLGRHARGESLLVRALGIQERVLGDHHPDLSWSYWSLASAQEALRDTASARGSYERALSILERAYGPVHPDRIRVLAAYAGFLARSRDSTQALDVALKAASARAEQLRSVVRGLADRQALTYSASAPAALDEAVRLAVRGVGGAQGARRTLDSVIRSRTLVLDEMASRQQIVSGAGADSALAQAGRAVESARRRYAGMLVRGARADDPDRFRAVLDRAREEMERAERELAGRSGAFRRDADRARIGYDAVASALPEDGALVAFVAYGAERARAYAAFVLRRGAEPALVPLGRGAVVDAAIAELARVMPRAPSEERGPGAQRAERDCRAAGEALRRLVWDPIAARLGAARRVYLVPDGEIHRVSFAALPVGAADYLVESGPLLCYLTSERDLVRPPRPPLGKGLIALGGPSYDFRSAGAGADDARTDRAGRVARGPSPAARGPLPDCPGFGDIRFEPLPEAVQEVDELARLWPDSASAVALTGSAARESALEGMVHGPRVLHLATHGFFLDATRCVPGQGRRGIGGVAAAQETAALVSAGSPHAGPRSSNPLLLSGLAFAGANRRAEAGPDQDDGILTAQEAASLDLSGTEWAVLSACDTGLGHVQSGEGVLGLRRAFQIAGARTVIMSLWAVDDRATRRWMKMLYEGKFRDGLGTAEAVRDACRSVLREQRAQGRSTHPFYWAGFVAVGEEQ